jgi:hypothetical protein
MDPLNLKETLFSESTPLMEKVLGHPAIAFILYFGSSHYTIFVLMFLLGQQGVDLMTILLPVSLVQFIISVVLIAHKVVNRSSFMTRSSILNFSGLHTAILGFTYTFGYIIPSIFLFSLNKKHFLQSFMVLSLPTDLVFTVLLSWMMLNRPVISYSVL